MALILAKPGPATNLRKAMHDFEKILSKEERKEYLAQKEPDAVAAINLATLIDKNSKRCWCMGSRLTSFLQSILQFSTVLSSTADTFVSSHPEIAALVWGGVKLALIVLLASNSWFWAKLRRLVTM